MSSLRKVIYTVKQKVSILAISNLSSLCCSRLASRSLVVEVKLGREQKAGFPSLRSSPGLSVLTRATVVLQWGALGAGRTFCLVFTPLELGFLGGLRKVLACLGCPLQLSRMLKTWKMSGEHVLGQDERGFGEWSHVQGEMPSGCAQSR